MYTDQIPDLIQLGMAVRNRRRELNLTQTQLAERLGWGQERVSVLETGKYGLPSLPLLAHLARALEVPLAVLMEAVGFGVRGVPSQESSAENGANEHRVASDGMNILLHYTLQRLLEIQALTLKDALNEASDLLAEAMGADKIDIFMYEEEIQTLVALGTSNSPLGRQQVRVGLDRVPIANGGRQVEVFTTGQEYYTGHGDQDPELDRGVVHTLGVRSMYAVPLRVNGAMRGIIVAESVHPDRFSPAERDFFEAASRWIGMVAHRAELHETVTRQAMEEARRHVADEMLETVAHDLQNQITPIKGEVDLVRRRMRRSNDERDIPQMDHVSRSLHRLTRMVSDLLDVSRLEGGLFSVTCRRFDLVDLVHDVVAEATPRRAEIQVRAPQELLVEADSARLAQALQNVVGNAVQHTPEGVPIVISVGKRTLDGCEWAMLEIHDEGPGIPSDLLPHVFERNVTGRGDGAGLGIGLYLARGIATAHGGELTVESEPGVGTTFTLMLPVEQKVAAL